jgi:hypothetical protein
MGAVDAKIDVFEDGAVVWPDESGAFMVGDFRKWPK